MLKTRLDGRSSENSSFQLKDKDGKVLATINLVSQLGVTLEISTEDELYIEKPSGWNSMRKHDVPN